MDSKKRRKPENQVPSEINFEQICLSRIRFHQPAPDKDVFLPESSFAKQSHDDDHHHDHDINYRFVW